MIKENNLKISLAYLLLIPIAIVLICTLASVPLFVNETVNLDNSLILESRQSLVAPERIEQTRYILSIFIVPTIFTLIFIFHKKIVNLITKQILIFYSGLFSQIILFVFCIFNAKTGNIDVDGIHILSPYQLSCRK